MSICKESELKAFSYTSGAAPLHDVNESTSPPEICKVFDQEKNANVSLPTQSCDQQLHDGGMQNILPGNYGK
jgi:hypothetical protein